MKIGRMIISILFAATILFSIVTNAVADTDILTAEGHVQKHQSQIDMFASGQVSWQDLTKQEKSDLLKLLGIEVDTGMIKSVQIVRVPQKSRHLINRVHSNTRTLQSMWVSVTGQTEFCKVPYEASTSGGPGPGTLTLEQSYSTSTGWSANVGVSAEVVSAGVGFQVSYTRQGTASYSTNLGNGEYAAIYGYPWIRQVNFDVWDDPW